ncbi:hypothetical protein PP175_05285 [Aneurinibacillus sp. Ricciae_BoGa-3]|nr:hypothetical protein [Aneurinibacillus sp. Ricciae_BoGa-3]WCK55366.1 hypothetical protein PP175_05285 [Aneurinibacillus sp. Ricciae_BoGa-3]
MNVMIDSGMLEVTEPVFNEFNEPDQLFKAWTVQMSEKANND